MKVDAYRTLLLAEDGICILELHNAQMHHAGAYQCVASNVVGTDVSVAAVVVEGCDEKSVHFVNKATFRHYRL